MKPVKLIIGMAVLITATMELSGSAQQQAEQPARGGKSEGQQNRLGAQTTQANRSENQIDRDRHDCTGRGQHYQTCGLQAALPGA